MSTGLTQKQRSERTQTKLIEATTQCLIDLGYSQSSIQAICQQSGLTKGALFRQYKDKGELMLAVAARLYHRLLAQYRQRYLSAMPTRDPIALALSLIRGNFASPEFQAAMELQVAARTDPALAQGLRPILQENQRNIRQLARDLLPDIAANTSEFDALIDLVVLVFQGEIFEAGILGNQQQAEQRFALLERWIKTTLSQGELIP